MKGAGQGDAPDSMNNSAASDLTSAFSARPAPQPSTTLGASLAEESRRAQGFTTAVDDPAVLTELRGLCAAPRSTMRAVPKKSEGPAS